MAFELSDRQQRTIGAAVTILAAVVIVAAAGALVTLAAMFVNRFSNVLMPLVVAAVGALVMKPYYELLEERWKLPRVLALAALLLSLLLPIVGFFWFFGWVVTDQVVDLAHRLPALTEDWSKELEQRWPKVQEFFQENPIGQRIREALAGQQEALMAGAREVGGRALSAGRGIFRVLGALAGWAVVPIYFAFFLMAEPLDYQRLHKLLPFLKQETRQDVVYLVREFIEILVSFFRGQLLVALAQGLLFAIGFSIIGLRYGFILGLVLGLLNIIPYLGSIVGLSVCLPLGFFQAGGGLALVALVILVFTIVQMVEGYLLTPKIMGDRTGLHPMAIIVAIFFWGSALNGIMGMILAIPLTAFLVVFWRLAQEKYIGELV